MKIIIIFNAVRKIKMKRFLFVIVLMCFWRFFANAQDFKVADIFSDNMVLQQKIETPIWGWGRFGKEVTVKVSWQKNVSFSGKISSSGRWKILIPTPAFGGPYDIFITDGEQNVEFKNVYIGEVWLASGQSNMSMPLKGYICQPVEKKY